MIEQGSVLRARRNAVACFAALAVAFAPGLSHATSSFPRARAILFEPGNPSHAVVNSTAWGLFDSRDLGKSWSLYCTELFGGRSLHVDVAVALAAGGRIIVSPDPFSGPFISDDACSWRTLNQTVDGEPYAVAYNVVPTDGTGREFLGLSLHAIEGGTGTYLTYSKDRGDTWSRVGADFPYDLAISSIATTTGNPPVFYAGAVLIGIGTAYLLSSHDGGQTWQRQLIPMATAESASVQVVAIQPSAPETVLVRIAPYELPGQDTQDHLFATRDGGRTWSVPFVPRGSLPGFAFSPDGTQALLAGPDDGLLAAPLDGGFDGPFHRIFDGKVWGLTTSRGLLYAGLDGFISDLSKAFVVGVSSDGGASFSHFMSACDLTYASCDAQCSTRPIVDSVLDSCNEAPPATETGGAPSSNGGTSSGGGDGAGGAGNAGGAAEAGTRDEPSSAGGNGDEVRPRTRITKEGCGCRSVGGAPSSWHLLSVALCALAAARKRCAPVHRLRNPGFTARNRARGDL